MKEIKLAYSDLYNAGDLMNIDIVEKLGNCKVIRRKSYNAEMLAIGGALIGLQYSENKIRRACQRGARLIYGDKPIYIWGSGFLHDNNSNKFYRTNLHVCALRGVKSQKKLCDLTGNFYDVLLADGGLLVDLLIDKVQFKKYKIGLIPHMWQQEEPAMMRMAKREDVHLINIKQTPQEVAHEISLCETIASSSLHGLVFADSLHIPNIHIIGRMNLRGGNFKFEDYYSSYGLDDNPCILDEHIPDYNEIVSLYRISIDMVEKKKKALVECFPKI